MAKTNHTTQQPTPIQTRDWTRRRFLQTTVAGTAVAWTGLPTFAGASAPKIVVVGAGLDGLNAAWQLKKAGLHADVYEAAGCIGGRVFTLENAVGPRLSSDLGGSSIDSNHTEMLTLAQELKAELLDYEDDEEELADTVNHHALEAVRSAGNGFVLSFSSSNGAPKEVKADISSADSALFGIAPYGSAGRVAAAEKTGHRGTRLRNQRKNHCRIPLAPGETGSSIL